ncbi:hypothetical protein F0562_011361 [Nyssa sinensis]|uniref:Receptor-like serine/threonine-protein kinase n=1 Tax=Nyssa sinensis TaxID=561372 RepID=A0A5J5A6D8_9ASTE|nr:hypothetical protein F0562_011361 [Nyssa sinensis]
MGHSLCCAFILLLTLAISSPHSINAQPVEYPLANLSNSWINTASTIMNTTHGSVRLNPILVRGRLGPRFVSGFYCYENNTACLFAVLIFQNSPDLDTTSRIQFAELVWSANRNNPVTIGATLKLTQDGDLILEEANGGLVWSTNTGGKSVSGLNLTETGNLVLFDKNNAVVWQSFDHPTDSLVPGQILASGQKLTSGVSSTNWGQGQYSLAVTDAELVLYIESNPPQFYFKSENELSIRKIQLKNGSFGEFRFRNSSAAQFMKLDPDGHPRIYEWGGSNFTEAVDLLSTYIGVCAYPMVCGKYSICTSNSQWPQCTCPEGASGKTSYFTQESDRHPNLGCSITTPLSCSHSKRHSLFEVKKINYFSFSSSPYNDETSLEHCKNTCLMNCSCKAAIFRNHWGSSMGNCLLLTEVFSLMNNDQENTNATAFLKVQMQKSLDKRTIAIVISSLGAFLGAVLIIGIWFFLYRKKVESKEVEEGYLDQVSAGISTRFSYEDLKAITGNFNHKLGEGGFGSVFEGTLSNGTKIAVKHLDGVGLVKKSFLAEVETIGSIHHVSLVRLIGFCAEKSQRLLVYEYMSNSSLNKWIFPRNRVASLKWQSRRKIIFDVAKGLAYLHEECRQKILHLDIKPQNILLDENFNAKVSDFGMSKLIDKDQSQVVTTLRGTPGYLAPEWLSSIITDKVDVYSFGVVVLEILCGRKNLDRSRPEEEMHLLSLFKRKAEENQLLDIVDEFSDDMQLHRVEVVDMMRVAAWCLQSDFTKRPSMSVVVKVLEGLLDVDNNLDYNFMINPQIQKAIVPVDHKEDDIGASTPLLPSVLSGPSFTIFTQLITYATEISIPILISKDYTAEFYDLGIAMFGVKSSNLSSLDD